jgi:PAS domain-containing protein
MSRDSSETDRQKVLRLQAQSQLAVGSRPPEARADAAAALAVLYELASSPATADAALKLLHELQVHQVELDLQDEELRRGVADLEVALFRQGQLYDHAPAGLFTVDRATVLRELNRSGAALLGSEHDALVGRAFDGFLDPASGRALHAALARVAERSTVEGCALRILREGRPAAAHASVAPDPAGSGFLIACVEIRPDAAGAGS